MLRTIVVAAAAALLASAAASAPMSPPSAPDASRTLGRAIPDVELVDERGERFRIGALAGKPLVLSPVFTRCPHACVMITSSLRDGLLAIGAPGVDYEVVTITFDPDDTADVLRSYRTRMELPEGWRIASAAPEALDSLLAAIDFHYAPLPEGGFLHANVVAVLTPDHRVSGYLGGIDYEQSDIRRALLTAVTPDSLVGAFTPVIAIAAGLALTALLVVLWVTKLRAPHAS